MNLKNFADRLRGIREERGITQQTTADTLLLPRTAVTQIENGNRSVSTLELTKLAKLYRHSISYLVGEMASEDEDIEVLLYRAAPGLNESSDIKLQINHCLDLCRESIILENLLGQNIKSGPPTYALKIPDNKGEAVEQAQVIAEQERKRLGLGILPVANLAEMIVNQGIWVASTNLPDTMSGLFLNNKKTGLIILVNADHPNSRKRFSYAHEYAHALLDREGHVRISNLENHAELIEVRANAFAAAFLMPTEGVNEFLYRLNKGKPSKSESIIFDVITGGKSESENRSVPYSQVLTHTDIAMMAHYFGVSYQAAVYRLRSLNFLSNKECEQLISQEKIGKTFLKTLGLLSDLEGKEEVNRWDRELKNQLIRLAIEAYRREEISKGRVLELGKTIGIGGAGLFELAQAAAFQHKKSGA